MMGGGSSLCKQGKALDWGTKGRAGGGYGRGVSPLPMLKKIAIRDCLDVFWSTPNSTLLCVFSILKEQIFDIRWILNYVVMLQMVIATVWTYLIIMIIEDSIVIDRYHWHCDYTDVGNGALRTSSMADTLTGSCLFVPISPTKRRNWLLILSSYNKCTVRPTMTQRVGLIRLYTFCNCLR